MVGARPEVGEQWTDSGEASEEGPLKHRDNDADRTVPRRAARSEARDAMASMVWARCSRLPS